MTTDTLPLIMTIAARQIHSFRVRPRLVCAPSLGSDLPRRRQSFVIRKAVPRLLLPRSFRPVLWTQRIPFLREKKTPPTHYKQVAQRPTRVHSINTSADLSPCNGTPAILGQHGAYPNRCDNELTRPVTTPSVRTSQSIRQHFVPFDIANGAYDASLTYISDDVVLFWQPPSVSPNGYRHHLRWT